MPEASVNHKASTGLERTAGTWADDVLMLIILQNSASTLLKIPTRRVPLYNKLNVYGFMYKVSAA